MLRLKNVTKTYAGGKVAAVSDLSLEVKAGEIFGFIGPNGAGKTTTIKMIAGILKPDRGIVTVCGIDMRSRPEEAKTEIGYVPDSADVYDRLSGLEYLNFIADVYGVGRTERAGRIEKYLTQFGLTSAAGEQIRSYSHGMKQKLMLTAALLHQPRLWLLDEPLVGLDPKAAHLLKEQMREHCDKGNAVFFSTHILEVAERLCDRIAVIDAGRVIASGTLDELRAGAQGSSLEDVFLRLTSEEQEVWP